MQPPSRRERRDGRRRKTDRGAKSCRETLNRSRRAFITSREDFNSSGKAFDRACKAFNPAGHAFRSARECFNSARQARKEPVPPPARFVLLRIEQRTRIADFVIPLAATSIAVV
jgi:hypothetical protein